MFQTSEGRYMLFIFRFPHRLDHATSGALCVAFTKNGARWSGKAFEKRYVTKHYLALVRIHYFGMNIKCFVVYETGIFLYK